jgi:hypothetical protein
MSDTYLMFSIRDTLELKYELKDAAIIYSMKIAKPEKRIILRTML